MSTIEEAGIEIECTDGKIQQCFPRLAAWIAGHLENITLHGIQQNQCIVCETTSDQLGTYTRRSAAICDYEKYRTPFNKYHDGDIKAGEDLTN